MIQAAAEAGVPDAGRFFSLTPREVYLALCAHRARLRQKETDRLLLARLTALALHAPKLLPPLPPAPAGLSREMTDEEMKQRLLAWRGKEQKP